MGAMKRILILPALLLALAAHAEAPKPIDIDAFLKKAKTFDKKVVAVSGKVGRFAAKTSKSGNPYVLFELLGKDGKVKVYLRGKLEKEPKDGDRVLVTGMYEVERKSGDRVYKNEIDATPEKGKPHGVKILAAKK